MIASILARDLGEWQQAGHTATEALAVFSEIGSEHEKAHARSVIAVVEHATGNVDRAATVAQDCLDVFRRVADHRCVSGMLLLLADVEGDLGHPDEAIRLLRETLKVATSGAHARTVPFALERLARLLEGTQPLSAVALLAAAETARRHGRMASAAVPDLQSLRQRTDPGAFRAAWLRGSLARGGDLVAISDAISPGLSRPELGSRPEPRRIGDSNS
jgi:Tetratricopeptide repeat